jgi:hypothetical protein
MRKWGTALAGSLALALLPVGVASATPAGSGVQASYDIAFDGYCDGLHLAIPSTGLGAVGTLDGSQTGCVSDSAFGRATPNKRGKYGVTKGTEFVQYATPAAFAYFTVVRNDLTWTHYILGPGNTETVLNSGTWHLGTPAAARGVPSASAAAKAAVGAASVAPQLRADIVFDGYCDGLSLRTPSAGLHTKGTLDGVSTGCYAEGVIGASATVAGTSNWMVGVIRGGVSYQYWVLGDFTWVVYGTAGGVITVVNSGTWSYGTPVAGAKASVRG